MKPDSMGKQVTAVLLRAARCAPSHTLSIGSKLPNEYDANSKAKNGNCLLITNSKNATEISNMHGGASVKNYALQQ